jgi:hypothetical protein
VHQHDRGCRRTHRPIREALPVEQALAAPGLVTGRQTWTTFIWLSNTMRGALGGPVTGRVNAFATDEETANDSPAISATAK